MNLPTWMRMVYEDGELWMNGIKQTDFRTKLFSDLFVWEEDISGYLRFADEGIYFYPDIQMEESCHE